VRPLALSLALLCAALLSACGDTLQVAPIPPNSLEGLIVSPFPIYWLGGTFRGLAITEASSDPSGGVSLQYGNCLAGGQGVCVPPLRVITSADNGFLPGGSVAKEAIRIRGVPAFAAQRGRTIVLPTGPVVVDIYAATAALARAAARSVVPINEPGVPGAQLAAPLPDTGYGSTPLSSQEPTPLHPLR